MNRLIAVGGDARYTSLTEAARAAGIDSLHMDAENARDAVRSADCLVMPNPYGEKGGMAQLPTLLKTGARLALFGEGEAPYDVAKRLRVHYFLKDEALLLDLARQTAEGAIHACQMRLACELYRCPVLVIGYGRIARALLHMLLGYGARVTVAARSAAARADASRDGANAVDMAAMARTLGDGKIVFSTPPQRVLNADMLRRVSRHALIVDLSSPPYGVDLEAATALKLCAWREPALPGRYCPESAGRAMLESLLRCEDQKGGTRTC